MQETCRMLYGGVTPVLLAVETDSGFNRLNDMAGLPRP